MRRLALVSLLSLLLALPGQPPMLPLIVTHHDKGEAAGVRLKCAPLVPPQ